MDIPYPTRIHFKNLGRNKAELIETVTDKRHFFRICGRYLMSRDVNYEYHPIEKWGNVIVGGFRKVGEFQVLEKGPDKPPTEIVP